MSRLVRWDDGRWFMYIKNVTSSTLEAFEFEAADGPCESPTSPPGKAVIQLERPIPAAEHAVIHLADLNLAVRPNLSGVALFRPRGLLRSGSRTTLSI